MSDQRREITGGGLFIRQGKIEQAGPSSELPSDVDEILDLGEKFWIMNSQDRK